MQPDVAPTANPPMTDAPGANGDCDSSGTDGNRVRARAQPLGLRPDPDPEAVVLSAILLEPSALHEVNLQARYFVDSRHQRIFSAMQELDALGAPVEPPSISQRLSERGDLQAAGGSLYLFDLQRMTATGAGVAYYAAKVRTEHVRRQFMEGASNLVQACARGENVDGTLRDMAELAEEMQDQLAGRHDLAALAITGEELLGRDLEPRTSFIGDGLLPAGVVTLLVGAPGTGKTYLMLQQAIAIALGREWLDLPTGKARVGILELENESRDLQPRLSAVCASMGLSDLERGEALRNIEFLTPDELKISRLNFIDEWRSVARWVRRSQLKVLLVDSLERTHSGRENEDMPHLVGVLERLARETGAAVEVLHHERKPGNDGRRRGDSRADDLNATRGHSTLFATAKVQMRLVDTRREGLRVLRFGKVNFGRAPEPIYLEQSEDGPFFVTQKPLDSKATGEKNLERVRELLEAAGSAGLTAEAGGAKAGFSAKTFGRHARELGATSTGRPAVFHLLSTNGLFGQANRQAPDTKSLVRNDAAPPPSDSGQVPPI